MRAPIDSIIVGDRRREELSPSVRFQILRRDNYTCRYCGARPPEARLEVDHMVPVALGGKNDEINLVTACRECNIGKFTGPAWVVKQENFWDSGDYAAAISHYTERARQLIGIRQTLRIAVLERFGKAPDIPELRDIVTVD